jgi:hypothetical protein
MESRWRGFTFVWKSMLKRPELFREGFHLCEVSLPEILREIVLNEDWGRLDEELKILTSSEGDLFKFLQSYHDFRQIEFIISIRDASNTWEEDGIWHDDGSRVFAFSLSLTINPELIQGGSLGIRKKEEENVSFISTPPYGSLILFLTGRYGFEHKIHQVRKGRRIIIAGWCS